MIIKIIKSLLPEDLKWRFKSKLGVPSQKNSLQRIKSLGFDPKICLDIGAYVGNWTTEFKNIFPDCDILLVEGQKDKENDLHKIKKKYPGSEFSINLLGASPKEVSFNIYDTASSVLEEKNETGAKIEVRELITLDDLVAKTKFCKPDFIKIDTQGYELEIMKGGANTLQHAEFILLEVSFLDIYVNCPLAADVVAFMKQTGFVMYDICTLMNRPLDNALYQADILFVKESTLLRQDKRWI